jgi:hypothetical protein
LEKLDPVLYVGYATNEAGRLGVAGGISCSGSNLI